MADLSFEQTIRHQHKTALIAGVDEAGRGALAGPVVAAAVILPLEDHAALTHLAPVNDSKQLSAVQREAYFALITAHARAWGVAAVSADEVDQIGILPATRRAMSRAIGQLRPAPRYLLIDGRIRLDQSTQPQQAIVRGDSLSLSIAAASIIAKVTRDQQMVALAPQYPLYGFERHKGYGTKQHLAALATHGPTPHHRHTFAPLAPK